MTHDGINDFESYGKTMRYYNNYMNFILLNATHAEQSKSSPNFSWHVLFFVQIFFLEK